MTSLNNVILELEDLHVSYASDRYSYETVRGVGFKLKKGHSLGIVGETGSGKSSLALALMRLVPKPGEIRCGKMLVNGINVMELNRKSLERFRGNEISMIFQDPMSALNPVFTVGNQIADAIRLHQPMTRRKAYTKAQHLLEQAGIPADRAGQYPHEFSGGMCQRVMIAMALSCNPSILIADEPTTALDATIQAQILALIEEQRNNLGMALILITHNLGIAAGHCDDIAIMYAGRIVEYGSADDIFNHSGHPYTKGLFACLPDIHNSSERLRPIPGSIPDPAHLPKGCAFAPRCPWASSLCYEAHPEPYFFTSHHYAVCHAYNNPSCNVPVFPGNSAYSS